MNREVALDRDKLHLGVRSLPCDCVPLRLGAHAYSPWGT